MLANQFAKLNAEWQDTYALEIPSESDKLHGPLEVRQAGYRYVVCDHERLFYSSHPKYEDISSM